MTQAAVDSVHGTLVASTVTTVNIDSGPNSSVESIEVVNVDGADEIYFVLGGGNAPPSDPTVGGADTRVIPAVTGQSYLIPLRTARKFSVKLISAGTPTYSVIAEKT